MLASSVMGAFGKALTDDMAQLPNMQVLIALLRDGFHDDSAGGRVRIDDSGQPIFDYDIHDRLWEGLRRAYLTMAEIQFAAGATRVRPGHPERAHHPRWSQAKPAPPPPPT